jgi:hypothetical protein
LERDFEEVMKEEILAIFEEFHSKGKFEKSFNSTFVSLIPRRPVMWILKTFVLLYLLKKCGFGEKRRIG